MWKEKTNILWKEKKEVQGVIECINSFECK